MKFLINTILISMAILISACDTKSSKTENNSTINQEQKQEVVKSFKVKERSKVSFTFKNSASNIKAINGLDSELFEVKYPTVTLNIIPLADNPKDFNKDNIYEIKLDVTDKNSSYNYIMHLKIEVTKDGNSSSSSNLSDTDGDYIPDNIEKLIGYDSNNSDQNSNGILDGLEGDKFFSKQWYIHSTGDITNPSNVQSVLGNDLHLLDVYKKYMGYNNGNPIILQVVDSGIDINHEDLKGNIDLSRSLNNDKQGEPTPGGFYKPHGTMLAGIIAAKAFNKKGVRGVAPFAKVAGSNWLVDQSLDGLYKAWSTGPGANEIAVTNNSWGRYYTIDTFYEDFMKEGAKKLRDGKGRIYVFASGNARAFNADANTQYVLNNQYAIVVSAIDANNKVASYSTPGANVWITAYGGSVSYNSGPTIATTYLSGKSKHTWLDDTNKSYTYAFAGSSASAPMVTASIGLILEACPNLKWRDVKYILAKSAKVVDNESSKWINTGGNLHYNRDYGFGLIDTQKAIKICQNGYKNLSTQYVIKSNQDFNSEEVNSTKSVKLNVEYNKKVEWVEATVDLDTLSASDFDIYLTSPYGTKVKLIQSGTKIGESFIPNGDWMKGGFRFGAAAFLDEDSVGDWKLEIVNKGTKTAKLKSFALKIYAH